MMYNVKLFGIEEGAKVILTICFFINAFRDLVLTVVIYLNSKSAQLECKMPLSTHQRTTVHHFLTYLNMYLMICVRTLIALGFLKVLLF